MTLPEIANTYRCTFGWELEGGVQANNVLHFFSDSGTGADLFASIQDNLTNQMFDAMSSTCSLDTISIIALDSNSATVVYPVTEDIHGGGAGDTIPAVAAVVSLRTSQRGSRGRGRVFLGPVTEDNQGSGSIAPAIVTATSAAWEDFRLAMLGDGRPLVVASYVHEDQHQVLTATCDALAGTMRKRQDQLR